MNIDDDLLSDFENEKDDNLADFLNRIDDNLTSEIEKKIDDDLTDYFNKLDKLDSDLKIDWID